MSVTDTKLFDCHVFHRRFKPKQHRLSYRVFFLLLNLDELDTLHRRLRWFSANSFNLFSFYDRDHGPGDNQPLRPWVETQLARAGITGTTQKIEMLCFPRVLGYAFNPLTVYYCYDTKDRLHAVLYEVNNTFGERHSYLAPIDPEQTGVIRHSCDKRFYVSPFMDVSGRYGFSIKRPDRSLLVHIQQSDDEGPRLDAWVRGKSNTVSDRALLACLVRYPLLTLKVIAGIHFEALRLWLKGIKTQRRPTPPVDSVTIIKD